MIKLECGTSILQLPQKQKISKRNIPHVDRDHGRGWEIAGPLFEAGATSISLAQWPKYRGTPHVPSQHRLGLVVQGSIAFSCGSKTLIGRRGDLVFTPAGIKLQRTGTGPIIWLYINLEDISMWAPLKANGPYVRKYESADLMYILTCRIIGALRSQDVYSVHSARESAVMLVKLIKRELRQSINAWPSKRVDTIVKILDQIREQPNLKWDRRLIARKLNTSERNLTREFKRIFNMPPTKMVTNIRMDLASRLLINTDRTLFDIASTVGYESPFSFSRLFKKYVGVSPEHYRTMPAAERQKPDLGFARMMST